MAKCPNKNSQEYKVLESYLGESKAHYLWDKYDGNVPSSEYIKGEEYLNLPQDIEEIHNDNEAYKNSLLAGEKAMLEWEKKESLMNDKVQSAIFRLKNRIKSLYESIPKNPKKVEEIKKRIEDLEDEITMLKKEDQLQDIIDITDRSLDWVVSNIFNKDRLFDNDLIQALEELSTLKVLMDNLLEVEDFTKEGEPKYKIQNKSLTSKAEERITKIRDMQNKVNNIILNHLASKISKKEGKIVNVNDLLRYKDVGSFKRYALDVSEVDNKLSLYINGLLVKANRDRMTEFNELLNKPLKKLEKEAGINLSKREDAIQFMQEDANGKLTLNLLDEYSKDYWDFNEKFLKSIKYYSKLYKADKKRDMNLRDRLNNKYRSFFDEVIIADVSKLTEDNTEETINSELERIAKEVGMDKAIKLKEEAVKRLEEYEKGKESYRESVMHHHSLKHQYYKTIEQVEGIKTRWEVKNDPRKIFEIVEDKNRAITDINFNFLSYAPKRLIKGKKSKWYDKKYENLKGDGSNARFKLFEFIINKLEEYIGYLPPMIAENLQRNYLPEILKDSLIEDLKGGLGKGAFANWLLKAITTTEDVSMERGIIGVDSKPSKSIPIEYVQDRVGRLNKAVKNHKRRIEDLQEGIIIRKRRIKELEEGYEGKPRSEWHPSMANTANSLEVGISNDIKELEKLREELPKIENKYEEYTAKKFIDIVQALRMFGTMAINYKHKAAVEDGANLALRALKQAEVLKVNALGKTKVDKDGKPQLETDNSRLVKMVTYSINALLYGEYKKKEGITPKKIGLTKEARKKLREAKKIRTKLQDTYFEGKITKESFDEKLEAVEKIIEEIECTANFGIAKVADSLMKYSYIVGIGWNPVSATANVIYGKMANGIEAAAGRYFNIGDKKKAEKLFRSSIKRSLTGIDSNTSKKLRNLINKYGILFDLLEDSYGNNRGLSEKKKKLGFLNALEMQRRGEYYLQGVVLVSMLIHEKVKTKNGKEISLFEAYNSEGDIQKGLLENESDWNILAEEGNKFSKLRDKVLKINKRLHGNYDPSSPMEGKETVLGRALFMFKSWMPEGFATRFEKRRYDPQLEFDVKGRYRTYATLGFGTSVKVLRTLLINQMIRKNKGKGDMNIDQLDFENMKRNLKEIQWGLIMLSLFLLAKLGFDDEDEDTLAVKHTLSMIGRIQSDITLYFNPIEFYKLAKNPTPLISTLTRLGRLVPTVYNTIASDHASHDADYTIRNISSTLPLAAPISRVIYQK